jgi:hypothetical protein
MVRYVGIADDLARERLAEVGTQLLHRPSDDERTALQSSLPPEALVVRAQVAIDPPAPGEEDSGMGAWHVNARTEAHLVLEGDGLVEFMTPHGPVAAVVSGGDVMVVRGGEHRYRPLTAQQWAIRHDGGPEADLGAQETGRATSPWPVV